MLVNPLGNEVRAKFLQPAHTWKPMLVNPLGNEVRANLVQLKNAPAPMLSMHAGRLVILRVLSL